MIKHLIGFGLGSFFILNAAAGAMAEGNSRGEPQALAATTQPADAQAERAVHAGIQIRDPHADRHLIDLTNHYTLALSEDATGAFGYTLDALPKGVQQLGNVQYDLRGIVQVSSQQFVIGGHNFPEAVKGITVGLKCQSLHFLHASRWTEDNGKKIGKYVIHYANGDLREVPIVFGADLRDWRPVHDAGAQANGLATAWHGHDNAGNDVVLFSTVWANPLPDVEVASIDMVSAMADAAPFLVAVTAQ